MHWNAAAERLLGLVGVESGGAWPQRPDSFTAETQPLDPAERPLARALRGEDVDGAEILLHAEGGPWTLVCGTSRPLRNHAGAIVGAVCVIREITEERRTLAGTAASQPRSGPRCRQGARREALRLLPTKTGLAGAG